ncbi:hypothetical protein [Deinococcus humi]|uniref:Uncharacterized protein n=1 Tax=Deinococcus humi TaxID=662880 RepID=A0A7W8NEV7_9DEIO|nr:hypothetical protein [Deinococcus humi]MBB5362158.1 hypothetical protein [Deinococcus humi]
MRPWMLELHWVTPEVEPLWSLRVTPPIIRMYDAARVDRRAEANPWGFP